MDLPSTITVRGTEMIYIPAGTFLMGSNGEEREQPARYVGKAQREQPARYVDVDGFYIARYPVTNAQYRECVEASACQPPEETSSHTRESYYGNPQYDRYPVIYVSWHDALAYCSWLGEETGQEIRLPTEAEWEKAARGTDGRVYPWGDEFDKSKCNSKEESGIGDTTPMGNYSPAGDSPYGVAEMAGNVLDWCSGLYKPYPYDPDDGREDLEAEGSRVVRGGAFYGSRGVVRCAYRISRFPDYHNRYLGFRVVVSPGSPQMKERSHRNTKAVE